MSSFGFTLEGDRLLAARLEAFPADLHAALLDRIQTGMQSVRDQVEAVVPRLTGRLATEIVLRVYAETVKRVAAYISVYTPEPGPAPHNEYAKAATLEYGSNKPRAVRDLNSGVMTRLRGSHRRIKARMSKPVDIEARRYLRGPFEIGEPEIMAMINDAVAQVTGDQSALVAL